MSESDQEKAVPILSRLSPPAGAVKNRKRRGRGPGSGLGKTSGKGMKGMKARTRGKAGKHGFEGGQTPLHRRLPKFGFVNPFTKTVATVNIEDLLIFDAGSTVDPDALKGKGFLKRAYDAVKVLGNGEIDRALTVRAHAFSASAREKIEKAGGKVEVL